MKTYQEAKDNAVRIYFEHGYNCMTGTYLNVVTYIISNLYNIDEAIVKSELNKMIKKQKHETTTTK